MQLILEWIRKDMLEEAMGRDGIYPDAEKSVMENGSEELRKIIEGTPQRRIKGAVIDMMSLFGDGRYVALVGAVEELPPYWHTEAI